MHQETFKVKAAPEPSNVARYVNFFVDTWYDVDVLNQLT